MRVAKTTIATLGNDGFLLVIGEISNYRIITLDNRANRNLNNEILARSPGRALASTFFTIFSGEFWVITKI